MRLILNRVSMRNQLLVHSSKTRVLTKSLVINKYDRRRKRNNVNAFIRNEHLYVVRTINNNNNNIVGNFFRFIPTTLRPWPPIREDYLPRSRAIRTVTHSVVVTVFV